MNIEEVRKIMLEKFEPDKKVITESQEELKALEVDIKVLSKIIGLAKMLPSIEGSKIEGDETIINYCNTSITRTEEEIKTMKDSITNLKQLLTEKAKKMKKLETLEKQTEELLKSVEVIPPTKAQELKSEEVTQKEGE